MLYRVYFVVSFLLGWHGSNENRTNRLLDSFRVSGHSSFSKVASVPQRLRIFGHLKDVVWAE